MPDQRETLEWKLLDGFYLTAVTFVTFFQLVLFIALPDTFNAETRAVFRPVLAVTDMVFAAGLVMIRRGHTGLARNLAVFVTSGVIFLSIAVTGGFPKSPATPMAIVAAMLFLAFLGLGRGMIATGCFLAALGSLWISMSTGLLDLPDVTSASVELNAAIVFASAFVLAVGFFAIAEAENQRLRRRLTIERDRFARLAERDGLTGLLIGRRFHEAVEERLSGRGQTAAFALVYVDLDDFKPVNDMHGHAAGDAILCKVANDIQAAIGPQCIAARLGGDEFGILSQAYCDKNQLDALLRHIRLAIETSMEFNGQEIAVGASIGYAVHPDDGRDKRSLLHTADSRMYADKLNKTVRLMKLAQSVEDASVLSLSA